MMRKENLTTAVIASVPELPDCMVEVENRDMAYASLQEQVQAKLANNPWIDFIGMFEGDEEFAELAQKLRDERKLDINSTV
ncbi:hypothetical protein [Anabaena sp. UHCC 0399]|uniref:hypothetical protein n=1 Tax=Anabaena sp. UHCC 0399 TaxID=3110238 RepID=UPI001F55842F|nr:hypothetical protein [Anabaena sp. UHCC 0399]MEA5566900.1 hypothetical protein [Anabaena sp. UHCC 0399]